MVFTSQSGQNGPSRSRAASRGSFEQRQHERKAKKRSEAAAAHIPAEPARPEDAAVSRDGERRLTVLSERASYQFSGIYSINELLRSAAA